MSVWEGRGREERETKHNRLLFLTVIYWFLRERKKDRQSAREVGAEKERAGESKVIYIYFLHDSEHFLFKDRELYISDIVPTKETGRI